MYDSFGFLVQQVKLASIFKKEPLIVKQPNTPSLNQPPEFSFIKFREVAAAIVELLSTNTYILYIHASTMLLALFSSHLPSY
jgi:hypothetical protein